MNKQSSPVRRWLHARRPRPPPGTQPASLTLKYTVTNVPGRDAGLTIVEFALAGPLDGPEAARAWERRAYIGSDAEASEEVLLDQARRYWLSDKLLLPTEANAHPTDGFEGGRLLGRLPAVTTPRRPPGAEGCGRFPVAAIADDLPVGGNAVRGILKAVPHLSIRRLPHNAPGVRAEGFVLTIDPHVHRTGEPRGGSDEGGREKGK